MPQEDQQDPRKYFSVRYLPWLLGGAMLGVYLFTLNPWVSLLNLGWVTVVSGWAWQAQLNNPLLSLAVLPFHLAPVGKIAVAFECLFGRERGSHPGFVGAVRGAGAA